MSCGETYGVFELVRITTRSPQVLPPVASVAWRSALYVTNFREGVDDAQMREVLSRFTKFVSGWFRFSVWSNTRCLLALKANKIH